MVLYGNWHWFLNVFSCVFGSKFSSDWPIKMLTLAVESFLPFFQGPVDWKFRSVGGFNLPTLWKIMEWVRQLGLWKKSTKNRIHGKLIQNSWNVIIHSCSKPPTRIWQKKNKQCATVASHGHPQETLGQFDTPV